MTSTLTRFIESPLIHLNGNTVLMRSFGYRNARSVRGLRGRVSRVPQAREFRLRIVWMSTKLEVSDSSHGSVIHNNRA